MKARINTKLILKHIIPQVYPSPDYLPMAFLNLTFEAEQPDILSNHEFNTIIKTEMGDLFFIKSKDLSFIYPLSSNYNTSRKL